MQQFETNTSFANESVFFCGSGYVLIFCPALAFDMLEDLEPDVLGRASSPMVDVPRSRWLEVSLVETVRVR